MDILDEFDTQDLIMLKGPNMNPAFVKKYTTYWDLWLYIPDGKKIKVKLSETKQELWDKYQLFFRNIVWHFGEDTGKVSEVQCKCVMSVFLHVLESNPELIPEAVKDLSTLKEDKSDEDESDDTIDNVDDYDNESDESFDDDDSDDNFNDDDNDYNDDEESDDNFNTDENTDDESSSSESFPDIEKIVFSRICKPQSIFYRSR